MQLIREQILSAEKPEIEEVQVPEWGGSVFVASIGATARERIAQATLDSEGKPRIMIGYRATFASECIVDGDGKKMFTPKDIEALGEKSGAALDRIILVGRRLSKMGSDAVEEEVGNSDGGQSADSNSA